jgi:hypothetical protein
MESLQVYDHYILPLLLLLLLLLRKWVYDIKTDLREIGWGGMDWIDVAQDRDQWRALVNTVMDLWVP